ncbi:MAG TPA: 3-hydroxyacyl-CoA dehydrogenase NAD-binding domain-containing protein [Pirellulales bacterium]|nr:3-hydroxyacyl-CoA dehydrogenase NAD-binding domain-containing protein [Pirellulales bacterium]
MADARTLLLSFPEPDIAVITLDAPDKGANILSRGVLEELEPMLDDLLARKGLAGLIFRSAKPGIFIAGADIREFAASEGISREEVIAFATRGRELFARLSKAPLVTVAAIDGLCLGGGAELAMWCDRRLMSDSPKAQFGFPEVKLGMFPGWGGTARTPRMIGLYNAIELVTSGEAIDGRAAVLLGLASDVVPSARLDEAARQLVRDERRTGEYLPDRQRWSQPIVMDETELTFLAATASAFIQQQTKGHYPAPLAALELMLGASQVDLETAGQQEAEAFAELFGTPINRALINVFLLTDRNKKDPGVVAKGVEAGQIKSVGVVGAGIMGAGIAAACAKRELPVTITDANQAALAGGVRKALEEVSFNKATRSADAQKMLKYVPLVNATTLDAELAGCDLVIEAIVENPQAKQELYARLEPGLKPEAILASNTSAISIAQLAAKLEHPERFVGIHFFNPVRQMPLVEVIRGPRTSDQAVATAVAFAKAIGKSPIVVEDGPGFLVNRLLLPYMNEALELLREGIDPRRVENAAKSFGMPMGPLTLYDVVGLDTALRAGQVMHQAFPDRVVQSPVLEAMVKAGRLGQKSGRGFYSYGDKKGKGQPDPTLMEVLGPLVQGKAQLGDEQLRDRLFLPMVVEASRILDEKKVRDPRDVDLGLIFGIGFPPFLGGLLFWADRQGAKSIVERLQAFQSLGARYQPTQRMRDMAASGGRFYD